MLINDASPFGSRQDSPVPDSDEDGDSSENNQSPVPLVDNPFGHVPSPAADRWARSKERGEENDAIDKLMELEGLEEVKEQFLTIKFKTDMDRKNKISPVHSRYHAVLQGNPGTGKTTVARLYGMFLESVLASGDNRSHWRHWRFVETSGVELAADGPQNLKPEVRSLLDDDPGVLFVDEAYQLTSDFRGKQVLDLLLHRMESRAGTLVVIFAGYKAHLEPLLEHNPGLASRIPWIFRFSNFTEPGLWNILRDNIQRNYKHLKIEGGIDGLYMRIAVRRLARLSSSRSFGNARAVENCIESMMNRQVRRLQEQEAAGEEPDYSRLISTDIIGPRPVVALQTAEWKKLQGLIGLASVKESVKSLIQLFQQNYDRELREETPWKVPLNQLFVGQPGTGKTTVARLYGAILANLALISKGEVVFKNPADFIGSHVGDSEEKTQKILDSTQGKVLVIDEAYMLDGGEKSDGQSSYKAAVIDTIVANVQGSPGEDRCILLLGYQERIKNMLHNMNPGLPRRFRENHPFVFDSFEISQLRDILLLKMDELGLKYSTNAVSTAVDMLERASTRAHFSNAAEIDECIATAQRNYGLRQSKRGTWERSVDEGLTPEDFDPEFKKRNLGCRELLSGKLGQSVIDILAGYQSQYRRATQRGLKAQSFMPTNFVFKGPSGTGKKTTARFMGQMFYDMGLLSSPQVVECTAVDFLAQYVGQTSPKTRSYLNKAMGKVLYIDRAHRLNNHHFGSEAIEEIVHFVTNHSDTGRIVTILADDAEGMDALLAAYPTLCSSFDEEIILGHIGPDDCIQLLKRELEGHQVVAPFLQRTDSFQYASVKTAIHKLQGIPGWRNAKDISDLAKKAILKHLEMDPQLHGSALSHPTSRLPSASQSNPTSIPHHIICTCIQEMAERRRRQAAAKPGAQSHSRNPTPAQSQFHKSANANLQPPLNYATNEEISHNFASRSRANAPERSDIQSAERTQRRLEKTQQPNVLNEDTMKNVLADYIKLRSAEVRDKDKKQFIGADKGGEASSQSLTSSRVHIRDPGVSDEIWEQLQADKKKMQERTREEEQEEKDVQKKLKEMGVCPLGFHWIKQDGGYRCEGGSHFVGNEQL